MSVARHAASVSARRRRQPGRPSFGLGRGRDRARAGGDRGTVRIVSAAAGDESGRCFLVAQSAWRKPYLVLPRSPASCPVSGTLSAVAAFDGVGGSVREGAVFHSCVRHRCPGGGAGLGGLARTRRSPAAGDLESGLPRRSATRRSAACRWRWLLCCGVVTDVPGLIYLGLDRVPRSPPTNRGLLSNRGGLTDMPGRCTPRRPLLYRYPWRHPRPRFRIR